MSIETLSTEQLLSLQRCAKRLYDESRADKKLLYAAALRGIREEIKQRRSKPLSNSDEVTCDLI